ncbi:LOW QUALITY PROTEIN: Fanconi anemia group C protein [Microcaecilia unicolor]|uniref:LOW QUALITY PROTEIN: Fanconi anemia group C protein n=1 Tax=Microcaecilia unicolor TaxID=1415580 RepID=A0A6P7X1S6_9AMPH|nr:LOW QUALITY PROTEIN: Fanconi anemia group C protein [Microcaecilia unicolor]
MAHDAQNLVLSFEYWLNKAVEWGQATTLESQQDVCLHLPKLYEFLHQIYETLKQMNFTVAIQRFPLIGQLVGRLCWNPFVVGYEGCQKILMCCLCCLYSKEPQNPVELKANEWIWNLLCHLLSPSELGDAEACPFLLTLGYTPTACYSELIKNMVLSLVTELKGNLLNGLNIQRRMSADRVHAVSVLCTPLLTLPEVTPLLEALLTYCDWGIQEPLSVQFLAAVNEALLQKKIDLSDSAVLCLWLRHLPSLEKTVLHLFERLISIQGHSLGDMECIIKDSLLLRVAHHPSVFRIIDEIFRNALLETDGNSKVLTIIQVFTQCFVQAHQEHNSQNKLPLKTYFLHNHPLLVMALLKHPLDLPTALWCQHLKGITEMLKAATEDTDSRSHRSLFEHWFLLIHFGVWVDIAAELLLTSETETSDALLWLLAFYYNPHENPQMSQTLVEARVASDRLVMLSCSPTLSVPKLLAAVVADSTETSTRHPSTNRIIQHLLVTHLLFSSRGHTIAKGFITHMTQTVETAYEVSNMLARTAHRLSILGLKYQRQIKLAHELLQEISV